ncbi:MAG: hypothetical protein NY202_04750 [Mollicutes bacterium UO1]
MANKLKKSDELALTGNYSNSPQNVRKSFTAYSYQIISEKRIRKKCFGCDDNFTTTQQLDYDYCRNCAINGRYIPSRFTKNNCSECGDGSGIIKFLQQPPRNCKTYYLAKQEKREENILTK